MPTLFRLVTVLALIVGTVAGTLYVLAEYVQPQPREITKPLRNVEVRSE